MAGRGHAVSAPDTPAVTPGQADEQLAQAAREAFLGERGDPVLSWKALGDGDRRPWFAVVRTIGAAIAARQPQPAPGDDGDYELDSADIPSGWREDAEQPAPELAAAPELRAAMRETSKVQDVAARMLSWFGGDGTRRHAAATRAQLAHAYRDSGLTVPEELRRFL